MRKTIALAVLIFLAAFLGNWLGDVVHAQTPVALQLTGNAPHTTCVVTLSTTTFCFASDGLWQSLNGAAYVQVGAAAAGVTSFNGRTGTVVPAAGDYAYSQLSSPPTSINCGTTGCAIK